MAFNFLLFTEFGPTAQCAPPGGVNNSVQVENIAFLIWRHGVLQTSPDMF